MGCVVTATHASCLAHCSGCCARKHTWGVDDCVVVLLREELLQGSTGRGGRKSAHGPDTQSARPNARLPSVSVHSLLRACTALWLQMLKSYRRVAVAAMRRKVGQFKSPTLVVQEMVTPRARSSFWVSI